MPLQLDYATPRPKVRGLRYVAFWLPGAFILTTRLFYGIPAEIIARCQYSAGTMDYWHTCWKWESRITDVMYKATSLLAVLLLILTVTWMVPPSKYWLNARVPGWTFLLLLNWLAVILIATIPIFRP